MGRSLVEDDPDPVFEAPNLDQQVIEKGQTFWGFLSSIFSGIAGFTRKVSSSKMLKNLNSQIMYGEEGKKAIRRCRCGGRILSNGHCMFCGKKG